ncbi:MAG TPA: hypothetical protein VNJ04_15145 [Gemmatimonadaceae bacterium]|nr:hypothetical protein [Gemmatimonadaceae bacterium]
MDDTLSRQNNGGRHLYMQQNAATVADIVLMTVEARVRIAKIPRARVLRGVHAGRLERGASSS